MMWVEAAFSSIMLFSAILIAVSAPESGGHQGDWMQFGHLNDAAHILSAKLSGTSGNEEPAVSAAIAYEIPEAGAAISTASSLESEAEFVLGAQGSLDSLTAGTPYCLELSAKNYPLHAISCRGAAHAPPLPAGIKSAFSIERAAQRNGQPLVFSLRQWTDTDA